MQSFRQSNPIDNITELQDNIQLTKERLEELDKRLYDQIPVMLEVPAIRKLVVLNLQLVLKYFKLQITLNQYLNKNIGNSMISDFYFKFIIDLNMRYENKIEKMIDILKNEKKEQYQDIIDLIEMYSIPFYFYVLGENIPKMTAKDICINLTKNIDDMTLDPDKIKEGLINMSDKIQSKISQIESNVSDVVSKIDVPQVEDIEKKITEIQSSIKSKLPLKNELITNYKQRRSRRTRLNNNQNNTQFLNGGKISAFEYIFDPVNNNWVKLNSNRGINIINTYVTNFLLN